MVVAFHKWLWILDFTKGGGENLMNDLVKVKRALLSVSDKTGIVDFAKGLVNFKIELISTGGTARVLSTAGIKVLGVSSITGFPEMMDGRVKTLHPAIHGALLARRDNPSHIRQIKEQGIELIDLVAVNLYPFAQVVAKRRTTLEEAIENIDIGGPSMVRSAAKNFQSVTIIVNPAKYKEVLGELKENQGALSLKTRKRLAVEAFSHTAEYDKMIHNYLKKALR